LEVSQSDTLNFEIKNHGSRNVYVVVMFSEDPENSDVFSNPNSTVRNTVYPLAISGIMMILGILISTIGGIIFIVDWKNIQNKKRDY
jgi:NADH:ubiquinone oxidoreductase subunit 4 (subunit M)